MSSIIEAPRSMLQGITELKHSELSEIFAGLLLPLHVPLDGLPVRPLPHRAGREDQVFQAIEMKKF